MKKLKNKKNLIYLTLLIIISIILYFVFSYFLSKDEYYNYENIIGNSYTANDNSYLVLKNDKSFIWYFDKDNKEKYYNGVYTLYRGENAIKYISSNLSIYDLSEKDQRKMIENMDIENAIDHYYLLILNNNKLINGENEEKINKETKYYGFATDDYKELDFYNMDANNYAIFILEE